MTTDADPKLKRNLIWLVAFITMDAFNSMTSSVAILNRAGLAVTILSAITILRGCLTVESRPLQGERALDCKTIPHGAKHG